MCEWPRRMGISGIVAVVLATAWLTGGCETAEGLVGLALDKPEVTVATDTPHVRLTVVAGIDTNSTLALPLAWSVSDSALGSVTGASGLSATYARNSKSGQNTVIVRDQYGNEGFSTIKQLSSAGYSLVLQVTVAGTETTVIPAGQNTAEITVSGEGAQAPYTWSVTSGTGSIVGGQGGSTAVFKSSGVGSSSVQVTDDNGVIAATSITQAAEADDGGTDPTDPTDPGGPGAP